MMYGSSSMERNRPNFCHSGPSFFALLPPLRTQKIKILKKLKKHMKILSFYKFVPETTVIQCIVPEI